MAANVVRLSKRKTQRNWNKAAFIICGLSLPIIWFCIFWVYVNIDSVLLAFKNVGGDWDLTIFKKCWNDIFHPTTNDESGISVSIRNTFIFFGLDLLTLPFHVIIAYFFYRKVRGYRFYQVIFYLPGIISTVIMGSIYSEIIGFDGPIYTLFLTKFGKELPNFLHNSNYALKAVIFYSLWASWGGRMLLLGGALARVPTEILEADRIDGCSTIREIFTIIFPLLWPTISTLIILQLTGFFVASGPILVLTGGGYGTSTIAYWNYAKLKYDGISAYNIIAANGLILTAIGLPIILLIRKLVELIPTVEY